MYRLALTCLLLLGTAFHPGSALAENHVGDVHLENGQILQQVEFEVKPRLRAVTVFEADGDRHYSFLDIAGIVVDGEDQTATLLGRTSTIGQPKPEAHAVPEPTPEAAAPEVAPPPTDTGAETVEVDMRDRWISRDSPEYKSATRPTHRATVRVAGTYSVPLGDYFELVAPGVGADLTVFVPVNHRAGVRVSAARTGLQWDDDYMLIPLDPSFTVTSQDLSYQAWRFSVGGQFYQHLDSGADSMNTIYIYSGLGMWRGTVEARSTATDGNTIEVLDESETQSKLFFDTGAGLTVMLSRVIGLDFTFDWNLILVGTQETTYATNDIQYASNFDFEAGLLFLFR